jgi:hypothetical protein
VAAKSGSAKQFPAKAGDSGAEVAQRSEDGADGTHFVKQFVILGGPPATDGPEHLANKAGVVNEAIQRGLHPRGDVSFDGVTDHDDGVSRVFTYSVETVPASVDHASAETTTPSDVMKGGA